jgi:Fe-S-cluster containining protein
MNPACAVCRGACCSSVVLPIDVTTVGREVAVMLTLRGSQEAHGFRLDAPCRHLSRKGQCRIHEDRPTVCREYAVGGEGCRAAIAANRPMIADRIYAILDRDV